LNLDFESEITTFAIPQKTTTRVGRECLRPIAIGVTRKTCIQAAKAAVDDRERSRWLGMAQHWLLWAQKEEAGLLASHPMPTPSQPEQPQAQQQQPNEKKE
jgi:hypothetical protein